MPHVEDGTIVLIGATRRITVRGEQRAPVADEVVVLGCFHRRRSRGYVPRALEGPGSGDWRKRRNADEDVVAASARSRGATRGSRLQTPGERVGARVPGESIPHHAEECARRSSVAAPYDGPGKSTLQNIIGRATGLCAGRYGCGALLARAHAGRGEDPLYVARRLMRFASEDVRAWTIPKR